MKDREKIHERIISKKIVNYIKYFIAFVIVSILLSYLLLLFEKDHPDTAIHNISDSIWYFLVSITSVGYGDIVPVSTGGKAIGYFYIIASLGVIGVLIGGISTNIILIMEEKKLGFNGTHFENHIVMIGWNDFSRLVADEVSQTTKKIAVITDKKDDIDLIYDEYGKKDFFVLFSDYHNLDALDKVNVISASNVFISFGDDTESLLYMVEFKKKYKNTDVIVSIDNSSLVDTFYTAGVKYVVARNEIVSKLVASYIFEPDVAELNIDILGSNKDEGDFDNQEYRVTKDNIYVNMSYEDVFIDMKKRYNGVLLGVCKKDNNDWMLYKNPAKKITIDVGDYLIMMLNGTAKHLIEKDFGVPEGRIIDVC